MSTGISDNNYDDSNLHYQETYYQSDNDVLPPTIPATFATEPYKSKITTYPPTIPETIATEPIKSAITTNPPTIPETFATEPYKSKITTYPPTIPETIATEPIKSAITTNPPTIPETIATEPIKSAITTYPPTIPETIATEPYKSKITTYPPTIPETIATESIKSAITTYPPTIPETIATEPYKSKITLDDSAPHENDNNDTLDVDTKPPTSHDNQPVQSNTNIDKHVNETLDNLPATTNLVNTSEDSVEEKLFKGTKLETFYDNCSQTDYTILAKNYKDLVENLNTEMNRINYLLEEMECDSLSSLETSTLNMMTDKYDLTMANINESLEPACEALKSLMYDSGSGKGLLQEIKEGENEIYGMQGNKEGEGFAKSSPNIYDLKEKLEDEQNLLDKYRANLSTYESEVPSTTITTDDGQTTTNPAYVTWQDTVNALSAKVDEQQKVVDDIQKEINELQEIIDEKRRELNDKIAQSNDLLNLIDNYDQNLSNY